MTEVTSHKMTCSMLLSETTGRLTHKAPGTHTEDIDINLRSRDSDIEHIRFHDHRYCYCCDNVSTTPTRERYIAESLTDTLYKECSGKSNFTILNGGTTEDMLADLYDATN